MRAKEIGAVITVLALIVLSFFVGGLSSHTTITTTRTIVLSSSAGSAVVTEEVIIQPLAINDGCIGMLRNSTSTAYLVPAYSTVSHIGNQTASTTTVTLRAITTTTIYDNATAVVNGVTCTIVNPHYNATQSSACQCS